MCDTLSTNEVMSSHSVIHSHRGAYKRKLITERLEKYRICADARGDKRRFIGAVAGAVVDGEATDVAHDNGMYVIVQPGEAVEIKDKAIGLNCYNSR